jgi:hypothetical protein
MSRARTIADFGDGIATADIGDGQITTAKIASDAITDALLPAGSVLQVVQAVQASDVILSNNNTYTNTGLSASITPSSANSKILVLVTQKRRIVGTTDYFNYFGFTQLLRSSTILEEKTINLGAGNSNGGTNSLGCDQVFIVLDSPNTTASVTYSTQIKGAFTSVNSTDEAGQGSTITLVEIAA